MPLTERPAGVNETTFGTPREGAGPCTIAINNPVGSASGIVLMDNTAVTPLEKVLWVQSDGKLYIGTRAQFLALSGGTVVGTQS